MNPQGKPEDWHLGIEVKITNQGKSPATILDGSLVPRPFPTLDKTGIPLIPALPDIPEYKLDGREITSIGSVYVPAQHFILGAAIPKIVLTTENASWRLGERCFCIYGFIKYEDAFKIIRETRFCFVYQAITETGFLVDENTKDAILPPSFYKAGPAQYRQIT